MANAVYDLAREAFLAATPTLSWANDTFKVALTRSYAPNISTDKFLSDVAAGGGVLVATSGALAGKTWASGVADANNLIFPQVATGVACTRVIIFKDTGDPATSPLVACLDSVTGLPVTPNGKDILLTWDNGADRIFRL